MELDEWMRRIEVSGMFFWFEFRPFVSVTVALSLMNLFVYFIFFVMGGGGG